MKQVKTIIAIMLIMVMLFGLVACNEFQRIEKISDTDFMNAIEEVLGADIDDVYAHNDNDGRRSIYYRYGESCSVYFHFYNHDFDGERVKEDHLSEIFHYYKLIENNNNSIDEFEVEGVNYRFEDVYEINEDMGYLIFITSDEEFIDYLFTGYLFRDPEEIDRYLYANYCAGPITISIRATNEDIDEALEFIEFLGLPHV